MPFVVPYDPTWPDAFTAEAGRLTEALGPWLVDGVHHIGSTSIPGMPAKPIIDMMAGVGDLADADAAGPALAALGYARRPHRSDAALFFRDGANVHLTVPGSELWRERLAFRDALRADAGLRAEYAELKQALLAASGGTGYDATGKRDFVRRVLTAHGVELRDGLHTDR